MRSGRLRPTQTPLSTWAAGLVFVWLLSMGQTFAAEPPTVENLRIGFANSTRNNLFRVGNWTPVWVQVKGGTDPFSGVIEIEVPDDAGVPTFFRQVVEVAAKGTSRVVTYARIGSRDPNLLIRFRDQNGKLVGQTLDGSNAVQFDTIQPGESLLLTLGKPQGVELIPALPGFSNEKSATGGNELTIARIDTSSGSNGLPARWYGYDAADAIVLDTDDKDLLEALATRGEGLVDWVKRGGHLVVSVGGNWQAVRDSVLAPILPALPSGQEKLPSLEALDSFAAATRAITPVGSPSVLITKLEELDKRGGKVLSETANIPLVIRGPAGFGRVTLVALSTSEKPFSEWPDRPSFWLRAVDIRRQSGGESSPANPAMMSNRLFQSGISDLSTQLHAALEQFPGVKLIPFGWVAFFIFIYILLIGPGDYFLLKKVFKRMELTWITFPLIVLTVSSVAYFAAYIVKGKDLKVNKVDIVDVDATSGTARGSTFFNLFSPQNRDYGISIVPNSLDADPKNIDATARPSAGTEVLMSWYGVPESGFGGMGGSGRIGFTGTGYTSLPDGGSERLEGVRVPIWATKAFSARWYGPSPVVAESDLTPVGIDRLAGSVTNRLNIPLKDAIVAFGKHVYQIGDLAPGATIQVELSQDRQLSNLIKSKANEYMPGNYNAPAQRIDRPNLMLALMFHDTESSTRVDKRLANNPLHYLDLTGQLALERPMLVARIDRPGSTLVMGNTPSDPQIDQTTMLRVVLPLGKGQEDSSK